MLIDTGAAPSLVKKATYGADGTRMMSPLMSATELIGFAERMHLGWLGQLMAMTLIPEAASIWSHISLNSSESFRMSHSSGLLIILMRSNAIMS